MSAIRATQILQEHPNRALLLCAGLLALSVAVKYEFTSFRAVVSTQSTLYIPSSLDTDTETYRRLFTSLDLGGGNCKWKAPNYVVPENVDFFKTLIVGYPSGDKRMIWLQMEALAGWPAKDEWDFAYIGMTNHPFIKANYPHHEGYWGWQDAADQVVLMVPYIRRSMVEYHDILADLGYPADWEHPAIRQELLYKDQPGIDEMADMYEWRDSRVLDEVHWYGWFIDYWMEGGLLRDIFTHKRVTHEHWQELMLRPFYAREDLNFERWGDPNADIEPEYDPHCADGEISNGCEPIEIISADKLLEFEHGADETARVATALKSNPKTGDKLIHQRAWDCIWSELIQKKKGPRTIRDRPGGYLNTEFNFSAEMLNEMLGELNRLITKYGGENWNSKPTAIRLVSLLMEHAFFLQAELDEVKSGQRKLTDRDFLGPKTRRNRRLKKMQTEKRTQEGMESEKEGMSSTNELPGARHQHLNKILQHKFWKKRREVRIFRERRKEATTDEGQSEGLRSRRSAETFPETEKMR